MPAMICPPLRPVPPKPRWRASSTTMSVIPCSASSSAVLMPEKPPPITTTSASRSVSREGKDSSYFLVAV